MNRRLAALASVSALGVVALLVIVWPTNPDRTDKILEVYAEQLDLTEDEARQSREDALDVATYICSIESANLVEVMPTRDRVESTIRRCSSVLTGET